MKMTIQTTVMAFAAMFALCGPAQTHWSDTPVTCHWIGAEFAGRSGSYDYAEWTNSANWAEGIVPGRFERDGVVVGCEGCTAVFDRDCSYSTVGLTGFYSVSNIVVSGSRVPKIRFGQDVSNPRLYFERYGGIFVASDVVTAPQIIPPFHYRRGAYNTTTTITFENNSSTTLFISGFKGPDVAFTSSAGDATLAMRGTGSITCGGAHDRSKYTLRISLEMNGGKFVQAYGSFVDKIVADTTECQQYFEIPSGVTVTAPTSISAPVLTRSDILINGAGTYAVNANAESAAFAVASGNTLTIDCDITRATGKRFQIGNGTYNGGTVAFSPGRSFNVPIDFYNGILQLVDGETFGDAISIMDDHFSRKGTISGGREIAAKITGGVSGGTHALTLTNMVAIASDITAATTLAAGSAISFCRASDSSVSFTITSLALSDDTVVPVEDGVTATIADINSNGHVLDIRPAGTGKVIFSGLAVGRAPDWLRLDGANARIEVDHSLVGAKGFVISVH